GNRRRGQHRGAEALERERRGKADTVELGLRLKRDARPCGLHLELVARGGAEGATSTRSSSKSGSVASSMSSAGRFTTARSRLPVSRWSESEVVVASTTTVWMRGCCSRIPSSTL